MRRILFSIAAATCLAACATPTPYQAAEDGRQGYAQTQIETNRFRVSFRGNSLTDRETTENYLLYRAAELTLESGYDYFTVVTRATDEDPHGFRLVLYLSLCGELCLLPSPLGLAWLA